MKREDLPPWERPRHEMRRDSPSSHIVGAVIVAMVIVVPFVMAWLER